MRRLMLLGSAGDVQTWWRRLFAAGGCRGLEKGCLYPVCTRHQPFGEPWDWGFHTLWNIYGGKPLMTVSTSLRSEGEGRGWLWIMAGAWGGKDGPQAHR